MTVKGKKRKNTKVSTSESDLFKHFPFILFLVAVLLYSNTLFHEYAFDDSIVITDNSFTQKGFAGIPDLMTKDFFEGIYGQQIDLTGGRYRPFSLVTFAVEWGIFGKNPLVSHLINILLFGFCCLLLFNVLSRFLGRENSIPYIASLIFCLHPIHTEVVANIKSRDELLCMAFLLLSIISLKKLKSSFNDKQGILAGIFFFLALLAKETAITYIVCIPFLFYVLDKNNGLTAFKKTSPLVIASVIYLILRTSMVGIAGGSELTDIMENPFVHSDFNEKFGTIGTILLHYARLLVFPHPLVSDYSYASFPFVGLTNLSSILGWLIFFAMGIFMVLKIVKRDILALAILLFLAPLSITSNIFFNIGAPMAERFLFIPSLGFALVVSFLFYKYLGYEKIKTWKSKSIISFLLLGIFLLYGVKTISRNSDWKNNLTLFSKDTETLPQNAKLAFYYSNILIKEYDKDSQPKHLQSSLSSLLKAVEVNPNFHWAQYNLGLTYEKLKKPQEALAAFIKTLELSPNHIMSHTMLGKLYGSSLNDPIKAQYYLEKVVNEFKQEDAVALQYLGNVYGMQGKHNQAIEVYERSLSIEPNNINTLQNLGTAYKFIGNQTKADECFQKMKTLNY
jgi:tetratricopeptide (TPR) repeat protein